MLNTGWPEATPGTLCVYCRHPYADHQHTLDERVRRNHRMPETTGYYHWCCECDCEEFLSREQRLWVESG